MTVSERWGALSEREFRMLWSGQVVSNVGDRITPIALAFAVLSLHGTATDLGLVIAAGTVPLAVLLLVGGVWADRLDRRLVMLASDLTRAAIQTVLAVLLLGHWARLWELALLAALFGAATAFFQPAATGLVPQIISPERLGQANALVGLSMNAAMVVGPVIAGLLVAASSPGGAIAIDAASFLVSAAFLMRVRPRPIVRGRRTSFAEEFRQGLRAVTSRRWLASMIIGFTVYETVVLPGIIVLGPVVSERSYAGASSWGWMSGGFGAGAVVGSLVALRFRPRRPIVACTLLLVGGAAQPAVIASGWPVWVIACILAVSGGALSMLFATWDTTLARQIDAASLSRVSSFDYFGTVVGSPLGFVLIGPLSHRFGVDRVMVTVSVIGISWAVLTAALPDVRGLRRLDIASSETVPEVAPA